MVKEFIVTMVTVRNTSSGDRTLLLAALADHFDTLALRNVTDANIG
jgi:hypothetical protein